MSRKVIIRLHLMLFPKGCCFIGSDADTEKEVDGLGCLIATLPKTCLTRMKPLNGRVRVIGALKHGRSDISSLSI